MYVIPPFTPWWLANPLRSVHPTPPSLPPNAAGNHHLYRLGRNFVNLTLVTYISRRALPLAIKGPWGMPWLATRCVAAMLSPYSDDFPATSHQTVSGSPLHNTIPIPSCLITPPNTADSHHSYTSLHFLLHTSMSIAFISINISDRAACVMVDKGFAIKGNVKAKG